MWLLLSLSLGCSNKTEVPLGDSDMDHGDPACTPAAEVCDGIDNDCDGLVDDDDPDRVGATAWFTDGDGDGYGAAATDVIACDAPLSTVPDSSDCEDLDPQVNPGAPEVCNDSDDDCDGLIDGQDDSLVDASTWYADADGDGFGDAASPQLACHQPPGAVANATDCDDADASVGPGADERCDGIDNDCDGLVDAADLDFIDCSPVDVSDAVAWWRFDEGSGTTASDQSGNGYDATLESVGWTTGVSGDAADFSGTGDVRGPDIDEPARSGEITVTAWVRLDLVDTGRLAVSQWTDGTNDGAFEMGFRGGRNGFYFQTSSDGSDVHEAPTTMLPVAGVWYHLAGVRGGGQTLLYIDGTLAASTTSTGPIHDSAWDVMVGWKDHCSGGGEWMGDIDDVRIYDRALSTEEIAAVIADL